MFALVLVVADAVGVTRSGPGISPEQREQRKLNQSRAPDIAEYMIETRMGACSGAGALQSAPFFLGVAPGEGLCPLSHLTVSLGQSVPGLGAASRPLCARSISAPLRYALEHGIENR